MLKKIFNSLMLISLFLNCNKSMNEITFTRKISEKLQELNSNIKIIEIKELEIRYKIDKDDTDYTAYLENAYKEYLNSKDFNETAEHFSKSYLNSNQPTSIELKNILPVIKESKSINEIEISNQVKGEFKTYNELFIGHLNIYYVHDKNEKLTYITNNDFKNLNLSSPEFRTISLENLRKEIKEYKFYESDGYSMVTCGGTYESSLLLLDDFWELIQQKVEGNVVVSIPSRDVLLFTGSNNKDGIKKLRSKANQLVNENSYAITNTLFERINKKWRSIH